MCSSCFFCFQFVCPMCCVLFKQRQRLVFHLRAKHKIGKAFSCPTCKREDFSSYDVFNNHKKKCAA